MRTGNLLALTVGAVFCLGAAPSPDPAATAMAECAFDNDQIKQRLSGMKTISKTSERVDGVFVGVPVDYTDVTRDFDPALIRPLGFVATEFSVSETKPTSGGKSSYTVSAAVKGSYSSIRGAALKHRGVSECRKESNGQCRIDMGNEEFGRTLKITEGETDALTYLLCSP